MNFDAFIDKDADLLIQNVDKKFSPIFYKIKYSDKEKRAIYRYLFSRKPQKIPPSLKNRLINLYDPIADRTTNFPDGLRWCLNVYVGCENNCGYCYVNGYSQETVGLSPHTKGGYELNLLKDLKALKALGVPPAPLHISNSTDPLQKELETRYRHTLFALRNIVRDRPLFTSIVFLTKNPEILTKEPYLSIVSDQKMQPLTVQISCSFYRDKVRSFFEPRAPSINSRLESLKFLAENGVDTEIRIDPLFPSSRISEKIRRHKPLPYYSIPEAQTHEDLVDLIRFAKSAGAKSVISKILRVPMSKRAQQCKDWFRILYEDANSESGSKAKGRSWRLPEDFQKALLSAVMEICRAEGIRFKHCMHDVLSRS